MPRLPLLATVLTLGLAAACTAVPEDELRDGYGAPAAGEPEPRSLPTPSAASDDDRAVSTQGRAPRDRPLPVEPRTCPFDTTGYTVECGTITIDGDGPDSDPVVVTFARFVALGDAAPDPVVYLHGGPGGGILEFADWFTGSIVDPFLVERDVILYDQRGAGVSSPLPSCREAWTLDDRFFTTGEAHDAIEDDYVDTLRRCADRVEARDDLDLADYHSAVHADDLLDLIRALGHETVNLYGSSYGSRLAQTMLRDHPEPIRSVILSGVYPTEVNLIGSVPTTFQAALDHLFTACTDDPICGTELPDPWATFADLFRSLDADPLRVAVANGDDSTYPMRIAGDDLVNIVHGLLYTADGAAFVPDLLVDLANGHTGRIERLAQDGIYDTADVLAWLGVLCHDEVPFATEDERAEAARSDTAAHRVGLAPGLIGAIMYEACPLFPSIGTAEALENDPVVWSQPTLLFAGDLDPITPPWWAEAVAARLPDATFARFADRGHDADEGPCAAVLLAEFVRDPTAPLDLSCVSGTGPSLTNTPVTRVSPLDGELAASTFDIDPGSGTEPIEMLLPGWDHDAYPTENAHWRDLDEWDPTVVVVRSGGWDPDEVLWYVVPDIATSFTPTETPAGVSPRWERLSYDTSSLDAISYVIEEDGFELNVSIVAMGSEIVALEKAILLPMVKSVPLP